MSDSIDSDVLIVGAGPVGLFAANECARHNLRWRLIEERASQSEHSKALAIFPRTLEIFDMAGIVAPFLEEANQVTKVFVMLRDRTLARMKFEPHESPYPFIAIVPQEVTERLLVDELRRRGGNVEYETKFISAELDDSGVNVTIEHRGKSTEIRTAAVVGCDGAHSTVRDQLNLSFEAADHQASYLVADVEANTRIPSDEMQLCPSDRGPVAIFPISAKRRRIVATIDNTDDDSPSLECVREILTRRAPSAIAADTLHWSSHLRIHEGHAERLRKGRIFVAGDAAHVHSPFGGQGMNTGLHDIWNLVWKLDLVLKGRWNQQLLDTYDTERLPVIKDVIETTDLMTKIMGTPQTFAQAFRDAVIPMVSRLAPFQHAFVQRLSELGMAYHDSPIVVGPGKRYFDDSLRGGNGIRSRFILFLGNDAPASAKEAAAQLSEPLSDVVELRFVNSPGLSLVRPDGYIAYSSQVNDTRESGTIVSGVHLIMRSLIAQAI